MDDKVVVLEKSAVIALAIAFIILMVGVLVLVEEERAHVEKDDAAISSLDSQVADLQDQVQCLNRIVSLAQSEVLNRTMLLQPGGGNTSWTFSASYAGFVSVEVVSFQFTPIVNNVYARVVYTAYGVNYDDQIGLGKGGTAVFPVLPSSSIKIIVGNNDPIVSFNNLTPMYTYDVEMRYFY
jgi:hypothetical protein